MLTVSSVRVTMYFFFGGIILNFFSHGQKDQAGPPPANGAGFVRGS